MLGLPRLSIWCSRGRQAAAVGCLYRQAGAGIELKNHRSFNPVQDHIGPHVTESPVISQALAASVSNLCQLGTASSLSSLPVSGCRSIGLSNWTARIALPVAISMPTPTAPW